MGAAEKVIALPGAVHELHTLLDELSNFGGVNAQFLRRPGAVGQRGELTGARGDSTYQLSVDSVSVTLGGPLTTLDAMDAAAFTTSVDVSALAEGSHVVPVIVTPPAGLDWMDEQLRQVYEACGKTEAWQLKRYEVGHIETAHMRREVMAFLKKWL